MDYGRPERANRLASEYVLGTLRGPARRRFEALLPSHPALRRAVASWQSRLAPMAEQHRPVAPPAQTWSKIEQRLFGAAAPARPGGAAAPFGWQAVAWWRALAGAATVAALALLVTVSQLSQLSQPQPPMVVVLEANPEAAGVLKARFVGSLSADGRSLVLRPIDGLTRPQGRSLQLWAVPATGSPTSLGLLRDEGETTVRDLRALNLRREGIAAIAVSLEPEGGSKTGVPTGPVLSVGKLSI